MSGPRTKTRPAAAAVRPAPPREESADAVLRLTAARAARTRSELATGLVKGLTSGRGVAAAAALRPTGDGGFEVDTHSFDGPAFEHADWREAAESLAAAAAATSATAAGSLRSVRNLTLIAAAAGTGETLSGEGGGLALVAAVVDGSDRAVAEQALAAAASAAEAWEAKDAAARASRRLGLAAATIDLTGEALDSRDRREAVVRVANLLRDHLACRSVVIGLVRGGRCRTEAVSAVASADRRSAAVRRLDAALDESVRRGRAAVSPGRAGNRDTLLAHDRLREADGLKTLAGVPLTGRGGRPVGAVLVACDDVSAADAAAELLTAAGEPLASALASLPRRRRRASGGRRWAAAALAVAAVAALWIPLPYAVTCVCRAEPSLRRHVVAPFGGLLEASFAKPGDAVAAGDVLARMDGRDLRSELAGLAADAARAAKEADARLAAGDAAGTQRARLELASVEARSAVLRRRRDLLEVRSPVAGVVLEGDLERVENAPVSIGDPLYEVAPLDELIIEVDVPAEDFPHFAAGDGVRVRLDGTDEPRVGRVGSIRPRSEARGGRNVFVAEVRLANDDGSLRPGMSGSARLSGRPRTLGWSLFHKPWEKFRSSVPVGW